MKLLRPSFLILLMFVLGGAMFKSMAPTECGMILPDDSLFVLTGDALRIPFARQTARKYPHADLYIIGAGAPNIDDDSVIIESESKSTYQNAVAIRKIAQSSGLDRIVLITSEDHMNRARYLVKQELPTADIVVCPVRMTGVPPVIRLVRWTVEYVKYIVTMIGI